MVEEREKGVEEDWAFFKDGEWGCAKEARKVRLERGGREGE